MSIFLYVLLIKVLTHLFFSCRYKDGKEIIPGGKYGTVFRQGVATLFIDDLDPEHAGKYSCTIINDLGEAKTSATLTVAGTYRYNYSTIIVQL